MNLHHILNCFKHDKSRMLKVIAGLLILVIAFAVFLMKAAGEDEEIIISDLNQSKVSMESGNVDQQGNADMTVTTTAVTMIYIDVAGAVSHPSVVELKTGSRVFEAIDAAGGLAGNADTRETNLARIVSDGEKIYIPTKQEMEAIGGTSPSLTADGGHSSVNVSVSDRTTTGMININTADSETLQQLTGVGPSTAEKIINYRNENGCFKTIEDIKNVSGIGDKTFHKLKSRITV